MARISAVAHVFNLSLTSSGFVLSSWTWSCFGSRFFAEPFEGSTRERPAQVVVVSVASPDAEEEKTTEFGYQSLFVARPQACA